MTPTVRFRKTSIVVQLHLLVCLWAAGSLQGFLPFMVVWLSLLHGFTLCAAA